MTYMLITLARLSSSAMVCRMVLMEAALTTSPAPKIARNTSDSQRVPDQENLGQSDTGRHRAAAIHPAEAAHRTARRKGECAQDRSQPYRAGEKTECPRAAAKVSAAKIGISEDRAR